MTTPSRRLLLIMAAAALFCCGPEAHADITGDLQADLLKDQNGTPIPKTALFLLVASTGDAAFGINLNLQGGASITLGSFLGSDEMVIYRGDLSGPEPTGVLDEVFTINYALAAFNSKVAAGQRVALLWFPSLTINSLSLPSSGRFGFYDGGPATVANATDSNSSGTDGSDPWILPPDLTGGYSPAFFTKDGRYFADASSTNAAAAGLAMGLIPEPSSALLVVLGGLSLLARRRRRAS